MPNPKRKPHVKVKKEDEGKVTKHPVKVVRDNEGLQQVITVTRTNLCFNNAKNLNAGDLVKHIRTCKVVSITHNEGGSADVELEVIRRSWEHL